MQCKLARKVDVMSAASERPSYGTVARISPTVDRSTRTFLVEVEVLNKDGALKPGGFAKANINVGVNDRATTIPLAGLYSFAGINKLFLFEGGQAREIQVTLGEQSDNWVEIATPPLPNDALIITSGQRLLSDGKEVAVRDAQAASTERSAESSGTKTLNAESSRTEPSRTESSRAGPTISEGAQTPAIESNSTTESLSTIGHK